MSLQKKNYEKSCTKLKVMKKSGFDEYVRTTRVTMNIIGIWPATDFHKHWCLRYQFLIPVFLMIFFVIIPQTRMLAIVWGDLNVVLEILTTADIMIGLACIKLLGVWYNKKNLRYLLFEMKNHWRSIVTDHEAIMWKNVKLCKLILAVYTFLTYGTIVIYAVGMLVFLQSHLAQLDANTTARKPLFVNSKFFFDTECSPTFEIVWICQFIACTLGIGAFNSFDGFFIFSILHLCGQLMNLQFDLRRSIIHCRMSKTRFIQLFKSLIKRHINLHKFNNCIEDNFNKVFLIQMICYSVTLCLQGYQFVITVNNKSNNRVATLAFILVFTIANIMSLFLYCFIAEKLREESTNLFSAAYEINWFELQPKESIMLLNIMQATKSPFQITAGKFAAFSFEYFMTILKTSAGYLSMLLAVKAS